MTGIAKTFNSFNNDIELGERIPIIKYECSDDISGLKSNNKQSTFLTIDQTDKYNNFFDPTFDNVLKVRYFFDYRIISLTR
jgi:hypothetical protein